MEQTDLPGRAARRRFRSRRRPSTRSTALSGRSELIWRLAAEAYGEDYPAEVQPWGLDDLVDPGALRIGAAGRARAGNGRPRLWSGRPGLWLARATGAEPRGEVDGRQAGSP